MPHSAAETIRSKNSLPIRVPLLPRGQGTYPALSFELLPALLLELLAVKLMLWQEQLNSNLMFTQINYTSKSKIPIMADPVVNRPFMTAELESPKVVIPS